MPAVGWGHAAQDRRWGSITSRVLENFQLSYSFCPHSVALGSTQPLTDISTKGFPSRKVQLAHTADSSAILVVPNFKVGMEAQHSMPGLSLHYLLEGSFTFTFYYSTNGHCFLPKYKIHVFPCQLAHNAHLLSLLCRIQSLFNKYVPRQGVDNETSHCTTALPNVA
jgi:hypothetical protein